MAVLVLMFPVTLVLSRTTLVEAAPPVVGSAGNASGQVVLPRLSVEMHDGGVDVYEGDELIETVPWSSDDRLDEPSTGWQQANARPAERPGLNLLPDRAMGEARLAP